MNDRMIMKIGAAGCSGDPVFNVGDRVRVLVQTEEELKRLQEGHGGWNQRMARFIGKVGTIHRATENGDLRVKFEDSLIRWTFNPVALVKIPTFAVGETVRVIDDADRVKELQVNHGEWVDQMRYALGKKGKVVIVYRDNDLRVTMIEGTPGTTYTLNPHCVTLVSAAPDQVSLTANSNASSSDVLNHPLQQPQHHVCLSDDVISSSHRHMHHPQSPATVPTSTSSPLLMPPTRAPGLDAAVTGGEEVNRSSGSSTAEISDLLRQVQLRDTKFKCSRSDGSGPHSADAASMSPSASGCPVAAPDGHHHHPHHHHAMHRSPASRHSSHSSPLMAATTTAAVAAVTAQQQHSSPAARPAPDAVVESCGMETVEMLKSKIAAIEDMITCNICMEKMKNVAFLCGHGSCFTCAQSLTSCHMCRLPITARINLY